MPEAGFPGQHSTTTTVTSNTTVMTNIRFDPSYIKTIPGMLKVAQVLLSLLAFISVQVSVFSFYSKIKFFSWISMIGFWYTGILLAAYLFHVVEKFYKIPWVTMELVFCGVWTFWYLVAASIAVAMDEQPLIVAGVFGYMAMAVYGVDAFLKYREFRSGGLAQGSRVVTKQTMVTATPEREAY